MIFIGTELLRILLPVFSSQGGGGGGGGTRSIHDGGGPAELHIANPKKYTSQTF